MTGPALSRAECQRLSGLVRLGLKAGLFGVQYEDFLKIADLVEVYPIVEPWSAIGPTGEREEISRAIEGEKWAGPPYDHPGLGLADDAEAALGMALDEAEGDGNLDQIVEWLRDAQATVAALAEKARRAAALLRQPPRGGVSKEAVVAAPPSGVDRGAVLAILRHAALELSPDMTEAATIADCIEDVRALPEAKAPDGWHYLPELPPDGDGEAIYVAAGNQHGVLEVWPGPLTATDIREARAVFYAWRLAPVPPPLPEAKP